MSVLDHLASAQGRRDEVPNVELAQRLVAKGDSKGINELVGALHHEKKAMRHDALKALYEVAALQPELVAPYAEDFLDLLGHRDARTAWGSLTACRSKEVPQHCESTLVAVRAKNAASFKAVLVARQKEFTTPPQARRIEKLFKQTEELL